MRVSCQHCGKAFEARRSTARFCTSSCRGKATHRRKAGGDPADEQDAEVVQLPTAKTAAKKTPGKKKPPAPTDRDPFMAAYEDQLQAAGKLDTYIGRQAMLLARRLALASGMDTGSSVASLSKELDRLMTSALTAAEPDQDELDKVQDEVLQFRGRRRRG